MTTKERNQIKHSLKTNIDSADRWLKVAEIGQMLGANQAEEASESRKVVIAELKSAKERISAGVNTFLAEIDSFIEKFS